MVNGKIRTKEYLFQEMNSFRELLGTRGIPLPQLQNAYKGVLYLWFRVKCPDKKSEELIQTAMEALIIEFDMRIEMMLEAGIIPL